MTFLGVVFNAGTVGIADFARSADGTSSSFHSTPDAVQVISGGADTISGRVNYSSSVTASGAGATLISNDHHAGQLDFSTTGKTDQYRNLAASVVEISGASPFDLSVTISSLEIATPRAPVSKLLVTTPAPVKLDTSAAPVDGGLMVISSKDRSRARFDYVGPGRVRLRAWNSQGRLTVDVVKNETDRDMVAAADAAAN